ncbi:MAG: type VI secretion system ATPase TssH, partial [Clostridia bacterium]|nr:type VI secretion system ATPase TssH [Clostridia bacterium]
FYKPLTRENIGGIINLLTQSLAERLAQQQLSLEITDEAKNHIADEGYDPVYGARPLKRFLQSSVETLAAKLIIAENPAPGSTIVVYYDGGLKCRLK